MDYFKNSPDTSTPISASILNSLFDGWLPIPYTLTYASATTVTISGNAAVYFVKGMKIKLTQTTAKYFVVISSSYSAPNTTITLHPYDSTTSVANAAISSPYYSFYDKPMGFPDKPCARANKTSAQDNLTDNTDIKILFNVEDYDIGANYDGSDTFTVPISGYYKINAQITFSSVAVDKYYTCKIFINGSNFESNFFQSSQSAYLTIYARTNKIYLNKGDTVNIYVKLNTSVNTVDVYAQADKTLFEVEFLNV